MSRHVWSADIARVWRNYVPPNRPSRFELELCSEQVRRIRSELSHNPRVLILGSTTEYRDWAYEESIESVVVDSSEEYHTAVSDELTHYNPRETVVFQDWREMSFFSEFDLVVGDLAVGQVPISDFSSLLERIRRSIRGRGVFMTKSFFVDERRHPRDVGDLLCELSRSGVDPFPHVVYDLAVACVGDDHVLHFVDMIEHVRQLARKGRATSAQLARFEEFGWDATFKVQFTMPTVAVWERELKVWFPEAEKRSDPSRPHMSHIPMYICHTAPQE